MLAQKRSADVAEQIQLGKEEVARRHETKEQQEISKGCRLPPPQPQKDVVHRLVCLCRTACRLDGMQSLLGALGEEITREDFLVASQHVLYVILPLFFRGSLWRTQNA